MTQMCASFSKSITLKDKTNAGWGMGEGLKMASLANKNTHSPYHLCTCAAVRADISRTSQCSSCRSVSFFHFSVVALNFAKYSDQKSADLGVSFAQRNTGAGAVKW